jgi:hypothetical protein
LKLARGSLRRIDRYLEIPQEVLVVVFLFCSYLRAVASPVMIAGSLVGFIKKDGVPPEASNSGFEAEICE